jgi:low temperature requirement protein LtrA
VNAPRRRRLIAPPRLRTLGDAEQERHASSLELFFDLVLVVAVAQLGEMLKADTSATGFLRYAALFVPVWWAWVGYALYADRFETDDVVYRLLIFSAMLALAAVAVTTPDALSDPGTSAGFAASYVAVRAILVGLYARAFRHEPLARPLAARYLTGFGIGATLWLLSLLVAPPARFALWGAAVLVELATPLLSAEAIRRVPFHRSHLPERMTLFTIIVLGETVLLAVTGVGEHLAATEAVIAAIGFLIAACLWWSYFELVDDAPLQRGYVAWQAFLYGHLAVFAGITATGVGVQLATSSASDSALDAGARWALCGGPAAFYLALGAMTLLTVAGRSLVTWSRLGAGVAALALAALATGVEPLVLEGVLLAVLVGQVAFETGQPPRSKK